MLKNSATLPIASAARTATKVSPQMRNRYHDGVIVVLNVSAASGTGGLTLHIRGYDAVKASTNSYDILVDGAAITAVGTYVFVVETATGAASDGVRAAVSRGLPKLWDIQVVHGDGSSYTYSVSATLTVG